MAKSRAVWGIDVGRCALKAIKLSSTDDGVILEAADYIEHAKILSQPDVEPSELIAKSLEKFLSRNDISEDQVVVSVPGQHTLARFSKLPPVDPKKVPDIVQFEANQQIPFDMDEVIWDYQAFSEEDSPEIEVGIFAMKRDLIHQHLAHFSDVGIEPIIVQSAPLAVFDAMRYDEQLCDETTVLVDIGAENTDLIITDGLRIWTRTIPIGGNNFTEALVSGFKLSFSKAEQLKRQAASSKYARQIFQAMRPVFADLVGEMQRSIGFYTSTHRDANLQRLVGAGNAFKLPGLQKFLQQNLGLTVVKPSQFNKLGNSERMGDHKEHLLAFAAAYGLAIEGAGRGHMQNNLLPIEIARQAVWRKKRPWFGAAAACLLVAGLLAHWRYHNDDGEIRRQVDAPGNMAYATARSRFEGGIANNDDRAYAETVASIAKAISDEHSKRSGEGGDKLEDLKLLRDLFLDRDLVPRIVAAVHAALPAPEGELATADDPHKVIAVLTRAGAAPQRDAREQVWIERFDSQYVANIYETDYRRESQRDAEGDLFDYYVEDPPIDGFLVTLLCRTPHAGRGAFIEKQDGFVQRLIREGRKEGLGFYVDGVRLLGAAGSAASAAPTPRGLRSRGTAMPTAPTAAAGARSADIDPLTFEDTSGDWEFEIKFVVARGDLPAEPTPGTPAPPSTRGGRG